MNLNKAFKKRNKLQEELGALKDMLSSRIIIKEVNEQENKLLLNGLSCEEWLEAINNKAKELEKLVIAIDKANEPIKPLLSKLSIYKAQRAFLLRVNRYISDTTLKKYYPETDKTVYYEPTIKQEKVLNNIDSLTRKIEDLEEEIQKLNSSTQVIIEE